MGRKLGGCDKFNFVGMMIALFPVLPICFRFGSSLMVYYIFVLLAFGVCAMAGPVNIKLLKGGFLFYFAILLIPIFVHREINELIKVIISPLMVFCVIGSTIRTKEQFFKAIDIVIYVAGIISVFGIVEALLHYNVFELLNSTGVPLSSGEYRMGILRIEQSFGMATNYCNYILFALSLLTYRVQFLTGNKKMVFGIINWMLILNAFCTGSRAPLIVILCTQFLFLMKTSKKERYKIIAQVLVLLFVIVLIGEILGFSIWSFIESYFYVFLSLIDSSFQSNITIEFGTNLGAVGTRTRLYGYIIDAVKDCWWFGIGAEAAQTFGIEVNQWFTKTSVENAYLSYLLIHGFVGMISFIYFLLFCILNGIKNMKRSLSFERINFSFVFLWTIIGYILDLFTVSVQADERILIVFVALMLVYNYRIDSWSEETIGESLCQKN